jgi:3-methyladenine DNA glycosylase AlkC
MPGKLRRRAQGGAGLAAEARESSSLPLLEAAALAAGLPRALGLEQELIAAGYFELGVVAQWRLTQDRLAERVAEADEPRELLHRLAASEEARLRFHVPGVLARHYAEQPDAALQELRSLAEDEDLLVAEAVQAFGVRPRGVWVKHLSWSVDAPAYLGPLLEQLRGDSSRFVANAVGNALNDIAKKKPELVLEIVSRWQEEGDAGPWQEHIVRKALRGLAKQGDPRALQALGFQALDLTARVEVRSPLPAKPNTALIFELEIENHDAAGKADLVYEIRTPGKNPQRPRKQRYRAGAMEIPGFCTSQFHIRERIFDRKAAKLLAGECAALFFLNGDQVAEVRFPLER